jgi:hypothetical protein
MVHETIDDDSGRGQVTQRFARFSDGRLLAMMVERIRELVKIKNGCRLNPHPFLKHC